MSGGAPRRHGEWRAALAFVVAAALLAAAAVTAAGARFVAAWGSHDPRPLVVTSVSILADLAGQVGGERVRVHSLLGPGQDPHSYQPVPRDALAIAHARLVLLNGHHLDYWAERLLDGASPRPPALRLAEEVPGPRLPWPGAPGQVDPHLWMDPLRVIGYVEQIRDALMAIDPAGAPEYRRRAARLTEELRRLDAWIAAQVATIPPQRRLLITTHDAYRYFGHRYGLRVVDTVWGVSTEEEPSAARLAALLRRLRAYGVPAFVETTINPKLMEELAAQAGVRIGGHLYADALGPPGSGADTYVGMMRHNVRTLVDALRAP